MSDFKDDTQGRPRRPAKTPSGSSFSDSRQPYAGKKPGGAGQKRSFADAVSAPRKGAAASGGDRPVFAKRSVAKLVAAKAPPKDPAEDARIAKVMARAGLCSRRDAELWIAEGRVSVNGAVLTSPAFNVNATDKIVVDGKPLGGRERTRLFLFNKPKGLVTTDRDPEGRPTIFTALPPELPRLMTIGRLDINTEGLLLLTNDGGLARVLELPKTGWMRRYRVRANGETDQSVLDQLRDGVTIDGIDYQGIEAHLDRQQGANVWLTMGLREGKNREIKKVLEHIGLYVNRLIRLSFGPFRLNELGEGAVEEVPTRILQDQLGGVLAAEAEVDFTAPVLSPLMSPQEREAWAAEIAETAQRDAQAKLRSHTRHGAGSQAADTTQVERIKPGPRRHVSAMRDEAGASARTGPRQRIARGETADRKGRAVAVEHKSAVPGHAPRPGRNAERFENEKRRTLRTDAATYGERRVRPPTDDERGGARERPANGKRFGAPAGEARAEAGGRGGKTFSERKYGDRKLDDRKYGDHKFDDRKRDGGGAIPGSRSCGKAFGGRSATERPAGPRAGGKPSGGKPVGGKPGGGKPGGGKFAGSRPGAGKSFGSKSFGSKSFGSKPGGGAPRGPRGPRS